LTDTLQLRGTNARVRAALIREGTQRAWLPTQEADIGGGGQKSGVELGPRCSGSSEPARRWRGSELECFCEERRSRMWKREEGRSAASRDEAGRGGERMGGVWGRCRMEGGKWERESGPGVSVDSVRQRNAHDVGGGHVAGPVSATGCGRERGERGSEAGPGVSRAQCQRRGAGGREESEAVRRRGADMRARAAQGRAARFQTRFEPIKNSNGSKPISNSFKLSLIKTGPSRSPKI
jgi:hypothetical protein